MDRLSHYRQADFEQMKKIEKAIIDVLMPFRESTDPLLVFLALIQITRVILRLADKPDQRTLLRIAAAYLEGRTDIYAPSHGLWLPPTH